MTEDINLEQLQVFKKQLALNNFRDACNTILDRGSNLGNKDREYLTKNLEIGKKKYLKAGKNKDKKGQGMVMSEIPNAEKQWDQIIDFRKGVAVAAQDEQYGISEEFKASSQGQDVASILTGDNQPFANSDGVYGFLMTNPMTGNKTWMSLRNIGALVKSQSFDKNSKKIIHAMGQDMYDRSQLEDIGDFDREGIRRKVRSSIVDRGNIRSLTDDKMLDDSFKNNMISTVKSISYKNLGINKEGNLEDSDAKQIVDTMLMDKEAHINYLTDYYTDFMAQNWKPKNKKEKKEKVKGKVFEKPEGGKLWKA